MSVFDFCETLNIKCFFKPCGCFPLSNSALLAEALVNFYLVFLMSQSSSESDIWEYRSLKKTKRPVNTKATKEHGGKRRRDEQGTSNKRGKAGKKDTSSKVNAQTGSSTQRETVTQVSGCKSRPDRQVVSPEKPDGSSLSEQDPQSKGFCPVCQMPFSVLVVQSAQWHVAECLETPGETTKECPDGLRCSSSIPNHYKRYSHSLLAHSRAVNSIDSSILDHTTSHLDQTTVYSDAFISIKESSGDSAVNLSGASSQSASPTQITGEFNTPGCPNALQLLRSPGLNDIKKRKGWYPASKSPRSQKSQDDKILISTPIKTEKHVSEVKEVPTDEYISYSPLSELPADLELNQTKKRLFCSTVLQEVDIKVEDSNSLLLFNDTVSDDDLFADVLDQYESDQSRSQEDQVGKESLYTCNRLEYIQSNEGVRSSSSVGGADGPCQFSSSFRHSKDEHLVQAGEDKHQLPSPQSLVLDRLRKCISNPAEFNRSCSTYADTKPDSVNQAMPSTRSTLAASKKQNLTITPKKAKPKAGTLGLKQTDIGVFFGLKPLKEEVKPKVAESLQVSSGTAEASAKRQNRWRRKSTAVSEATMTTAERKDGAVHPTQTEGDAGMKPRGWKRWNRGRATDGVAEEPKRCPFYKKIPGTSFAVDAFQYGTIKGITAYFLTHFHSDHYGGLKKDSTLPIYCNKITGNLVKSKLKVDEQYVHILPMKEECTVDGVKVILLDANHCPGSAMLLFLLPDGQTVLHTGDFRADPSMERYPELQGIRIQTLYLDTTYCSPEYTFPTQQEVISFAANTAFELVTLNPRTLVVCGTYSVGKEKVFLAVSQVLGSKVYMSRDRYNTMCCLESEEICQFITTDMKLAQVHVLPMMQLNFKNLKPYLSKFSGKYDQLVAFKPTGWTFTPSQKVEDIHPQVKGNVSIYGIPYSEHSSFLELKRFVQWLRPLKIIPTVNVGSWNSRKAMNEYFNEWRAEVKAVTTVARNSGCSSTRQ